MWKIAACSGLTLVMLAICAVFFTDAEALVWHILHGNETRIAGREVVLPISWWKSLDRGETGTLERAHLWRDPTGASIDVRYPKPLEKQATDEETLAAFQRVSARFDAYVRSAGQASESKTSSGAWSALVIQTKAFPLYCLRSELGQSFTSLTCTSSQIAYMIEYEGSAATEREAEQILSTMQ